MIPPSDLAFISALCLSRAGLKVDVEKAYLIESRLAPVARREGYDSPADFVETIRMRGDERLGWAAIEAMTLPEPEFFRDRHVFETLMSDVLPGFARAPGGEPVRVWSAACGTGQEVYSLAMLLADAPALSARVELFASDLSESALEKAQAGIYSQFEVQRGLPARTLVRHFEKIGEAFALSPRIRQMVRWRRANLMDDPARFGRFDLVLCRGLLNQLAPEGRERVLRHLHKALKPGGRLVLGLRNDPGPDLVAVGPGIYGARHDRERSAAA
jgi:chemotaxis protein methyltransferase CheR